MGKTASHLGALTAFSNDCCVLVKTVRTNNMQNIQSAIVKQKLKMLIK